MQEWLQSLLDENFDASGRFSGRLPDDFFRLSEALSEREDVDLGGDAVDHVRRLAEQASQRARAAEIRERIAETGGRLPGVQARLYPYQVEGVAFLAANGRALLADDMGLGKTLQAISAAAWLRRHEGVARALVICPASLKHQWAREIQRFTGQPVQIIQGPPAVRRAQYRKVDGFAVLNYELILRDHSEVNEILRPDLLILDEAQRIKNWRTKIATAVKTLPCRVVLLMMIAGTAFGAPEPSTNAAEDAMPADVIAMVNYAMKNDAKILGPGSLGIISPGKAAMGWLGGSVDWAKMLFEPGPVGVISRSGGQSGTVPWALKVAGLGISTAMHIGTEPVLGLTMADVLKMFEKDEQTKAVAIFGEIGGTLEEEAAETVAKGEFTKPLVVFIAGAWAPEGMRFSHASSIVEKGRGTAQGKMKALTEAGAYVVDSPEEIAPKIKELIAV